MDYRTITYERDGHVAVLTYNRPEQRNAISRQMNEELHDASARFRDDDDAFVDSHAIGARAFKEKRAPEWPHHGL
jgi:enoyl-CoA hydratase/carnithine racemase